MMAVVVPSLMPVCTAHAPQPCHRSSTQTARPAACRALRSRLPARSSARCRACAPAAAAAWPAAPRRRPEAQRRVRHAQHVVGARDLDAHVGRHARLQLQLRVRHVDHRHVADDVLLDDRLEPHLPDRAGEHLVGIRVDLEADLLAGWIRPMSVSSTLALTCMRVRSSRDHEQRRRLHARGDGLPDVDVARDDDAVDRRGDDGVAEVDAVLVQRGARLDDLRLRRLQRASACRAVVRAVSRSLAGISCWRSAARRGAASPRILDLHGRALGVGLQPLHRRLGLLDLGLEQRRLEPRDHLALPHTRVEVGVQRADRAGHLRARPRPW